MEIANSTIMSGHRYQFVQDERELLNVNGQLRLANHERTEIDSASISLSARSLSEAGAGHQQAQTPATTKQPTEDKRPAVPTSPVSPAEPNRGGPETAATPATPTQTNRAGLAVPAQSVPVDPGEVPQIEYTDEQKNVLELLEHVFGMKVQREERIEVQISYEHLEFNAAEFAMKGSGSEIQHGYRYEEYERLDIAMGAKLELSDGNTLEVGMALTMERHFIAGQSFNMNIGELIDPLVVNLASPGTTLGSGTVAFDMDSNGTTEQIAELGMGNYFLALDKNKDAIINNGNELFGTQSGDGFADLAAYDEDGNGFIDAGDSIFFELSLYRPGGSQMSLTEAGIAAIQTTDAVRGSFTITDAANQARAQVQATGLFITEHGTAGSVQQVDFVA